MIGKELQKQLCQAMKIELAAKLSEELFSQSRLQNHPLPQ